MLKPRFHCPRSSKSICNWPTTRSWPTASAARCARNFKRGVIAAVLFEQEVEDKAVQSQQREGITQPLSGRDMGHLGAPRASEFAGQLTDFYFAYNLPNRLLGDLIQTEIGRTDSDELSMDINPGWRRGMCSLLAANSTKSLPADEQVKFQHHMQEIKVVLIKAMISDQLGFVGIAREFFSIADLDEMPAARSAAARSAARPPA